MDDKFTIKRERALNVDGSSIGLEQSVRNHPLLFEMLRSFTTLAAKLNLSHAVKELGSTRQTVRRHISQLEDIKGGALFEVSERQYALTQLGHRVLPEAQDLLARAEGWVNGTSSMIDGLQYLRQVSPDGHSIYQQQQPIGKVFSSTSDYLKNVMLAWVESDGELEHPAMQKVRSQLMVFRRSEESWLCVELGDDSSYVSWFGWAAARSSIGRPLGAMPGGEGFGRLVNLAYIDVETNQSVRLDHSFTQVAREQGGEPLPICFERLLLASRFPDGSHAMLSAVRRTYDVEIRGVSDEMLRLMPEELVM